MDKDELLTWLLEPCIKHLLASGPLRERVGISRSACERDMFASDSVQKWLARITLNPTINGLHGSKPTCWENFMGKLTDLGCHRGMPGVEQRLRPFHDWLRAEVSVPARDGRSVFRHTLVAAFLARAGYVEDGAVTTVIRNRLGTVHDFTKLNSYELYTSLEGYPKPPPNFVGKPLLRPDLVNKGNFRYPLIYDIIALAAYWAQASGNEKAMISGIIEYIMRGEYHALHHGYGICLNEKGCYNGMGWDAQVPGYPDGVPHGWYQNAFVQRMMLMSRFPVARKHPWFIGGLGHLRTFRADAGTYRFPPQYLQENACGYWLAGKYMGLGESRRNKLALELESTFWMVTLEARAEEKE
jgi:hypothetical protein